MDLTSWLRCLSACENTYPPIDASSEHNPSHMVAERRRSAMSSIVHTIVPLFMEEILEVVRSTSQEHIQRRIVEEIVDVPVRPDDNNKDQLSNTDARTEALEKSISELHESVMRETESRQRQHSEGRDSDCQQCCRDGVAQALPYIGAHRWCASSTDPRGNWTGDPAHSARMNSRSCR